jgi:TetR/AcrR family transcriptional regulator, transcriptional repressor for nem operon
MNLDTRERILDAAQRLAQQRGFNAFSYADVSLAVGIRKASIHHHFASKSDLELALVQRYSSRFAAELDSIDRRIPGAVARLRAYGALYRATLEADAICLCGMLASDSTALPLAVRTPLASFFSQHAQWIAGVLDAGQRSGEFVFVGSTLRRAQSLLATLQGGLLLAHGVGDLQMFSDLVDDSLTGLVQR